ncbi:DUF1330 domain-containing protein [Shewanella woodyi]|uniref:DUF1330 domain-containing protein n=1 Tax=Shewanella woodyi TaxID=60961 RepID=UPI0007EA38F5|nr:DUF1330 domain-containing protein [Shewanella woodyi]
MKTISPSQKGFAELISGKVDDEPIVMVNLLKFKDQADYTKLASSHPDHALTITGKEAYAIYGEAVTPMVEEVGGQILWQGNTRFTFIAPDEETWDEVVLVQYPSRAAFLKMVTSGAYQKIVHHRDLSLDDSRLIETQPTNIG